jgi:hypothetical protein
MSETSHQGGCHCGAVRYRVDIDLEKPAIVCNCSICSRTGTMLSFVPAAKFTLEQGDDNLTDYQFNRQVVHHLFCKTCGIRSFARGIGPGGAEMRAINVRCLDDVDLDKVPTQHFDGKSK